MLGYASGRPPTPGSTSTGTPWKGVSTSTQRQHCHLHFRLPGRGLLVFVRSPWCQGPLGIGDPPLLVLVQHDPGNPKRGPLWYTKSLRERFGLPGRSLPVFAKSPWCSLPLLVPIQHDPGKPRRGPDPKSLRERFGLPGRGLLVVAKSPWCRPLGIGDPPLLVQHGLVKPKPELLGLRSSWTRFGLPGCLFAKHTTCPLMFGIPPLVQHQSVNPETELLGHHSRRNGLTRWRSASACEAYGMAGVTRSPGPLSTSTGKP